MSETLALRVNGMTCSSCAEHVEEARRAGRDADLVFWTGDPFSPTSRVRRVMIDGKTVFEDK